MKNKIIKSIFVVIISIIPIINYAQIENLLVNVVDKKIVIEYNANDRDCINNKILKIVSESKATPLHNTRLVFEVKEHQKIIKKNNKLILQISVGNFIFKDTVVYKGFKINRFLTPGAITYTYVLADDDNKAIEAKTFNNVKFKNGSYLLNKTVSITSDSSSFKLYLSNVDFEYTSQIMISYEYLPLLLILIMMLMHS